MCLRCCYVFYLTLHRMDRLNSKNSFERYRLHPEEISMRNSIVSTIYWYWLFCLFVDFDHLSCFNTCFPDLPHPYSRSWSELKHIKIRHAFVVITYSFCLYLKVGGHWTSIKWYVCIDRRKPAFFSALLVCLFVYPFFSEVTALSLTHTAHSNKNWTIKYESKMFAIYNLSVPRHEFIFMYLFPEDTNRLLCYYECEPYGLITAVTSAATDMPSYIIWIIILRFNIDITCNIVHVVVVYTLLYTLFVHAHCTSWHAYYDVYIHSIYKLRFKCYNTIYKTILSLFHSHFLFHHHYSFSLLFFSLLSFFYSVFLFPSVDR